MRRNLLTAAITGFLLASCGDGDTTTIINKEPSTVTVNEETEESKSVFLPDVATTRQFVEPESYVFSVDGDLAATDLTWQDWGSPTATATGTFQETAHPSPKTESYPGTLEVGDLIECDMAKYYTELSVKLPPNALFQPQLVPLSTPCE